MRTIQTATTTKYSIAANTTDRQGRGQTTLKSAEKKVSKDVVLNVGFEESMKRGFVAIFFPWLSVFTGPYLLTAIAPVMFYLFVSALTHFCFVKYAWQHWIKHIKTPTICDFTKDLRLPVETI